MGTQCTPCLTAREWRPAQNRLTTLRRANRRAGTAPGVVSSHDAHGHVPGRPPRGEDHYESVHCPEPQGQAFFFWWPSLHREGPECLVAVYCRRVVPLRRSGTGMCCHSSPTTTPPASCACLRQYTQFNIICIFIHGNVHIKHAPTRESSVMLIIYTELDRKHMHPHGNRDTFTFGGVCLGGSGCEFPCMWGVACVLD